MTPPPLDPRERSTRTLALIIGTVVAAGTAIADALTPANTALPILYFIPLAVFARARNAMAVWILAVTLAVLTFVLYLVGSPPSYEEISRITTLNRVMAMVTLLVMAVVLHRQIRNDQALELQHERTSEQNLALEAANEELGRREEEIVRQNEELQSQTEELERQGEELRVTNEDLAAREKALEQLLELARALTVDLTREEVLKKVCDSLPILTLGTVAAVLERRGDQLVVVCHYGFAGGPDLETIPVEASMAALVLSVGQTGFVQDLRQRPDLRIPQPRSGERLLSVLSTPVRVRGRSIGTLEVYAPSAQTFSEVQVAIVESVAAQLSISLQNAELLHEVVEQRQRFEAAFRSVPFGMTLVADPEAKEVRVNPAGAAMLGVPAGENLSPGGRASGALLRATFKDGRPVEERNTVLQRVLRGEEVRHEEVDLAMPDGRRLSLVVGGAPFLDSEGRVTGGVTAFVDVSAQKVALREVELRRREAEEASVRKTRFLAALSHDIRTPANAIHLLTELIRRAVATPALAPQIPEMAQRLENSVTTLLNLVGDLLDLSRFDSGKVEIIESEFPLNDLLEEEGGQLRPAALARGLELLVEPATRPVWLRTDRVKLARVVGNLLDNAIKFTAAGSVRVSAEVLDRPDRRVLVRVADTGPGIPAEHLASIFDEFLQLRNPERDRSKGSGLGLAISKRLVDLLGGSIRVESTPGVRTVFTVELPPSVVALRLEGGPIARAGAAPAREERLASPRERLRGLRILLVEDHADTRIGMREFLVQEGARVDEAPNGATALARLRQSGHDVVLLDLMLPDMDGSEVLKAIEDDRPAGLRGVLVLTGDAQRDRSGILRTVRPDAILQKPVDLGILVGALQALMRHPAAKPGE